MATKDAGDNRRTVEAVFSMQLVLMLYNESLETAARRIGISC
jgi:hypothetical protein